MYRYSKLMAACTACLAYAAPCFAQSFSADTSSRDALIENTVVSYYKGIGDQSRLYNGPEYYFYDPIIKGNAYYNDNNNFTQGTVEYDGFVFKNVSLLYDLYKDEAVVLMPNKISKYSLVKERVQNFDISGHHFVYVSADTLRKPGSFSTGFYDELYNGKTAVLVKRKKTIQNNSNVAGTIETYFTADKNIYIANRGNYTRVSGQGAVLGVLKDKKAELKQFINDKKLTFKANQEQDIAMVAAYYDQLTK